MASYKVIDSSKSKAFLSVAMLTYNHGLFIKEAIESILNQITDFPIKIIVADDASIDNSLNILLDYQAKFPDKIKLLLQNRNVGPKKNNIDLLSNLEGKYIAALEGDDYWTDPLKLQKQVDFLEANPNYSFCWTRFKTLDQNTQELVIDFNTKYFPNKENVIDFDFETFYKGWHIGTQTLVFKNSINLESHNKFNYFRDVHIIAQLLKKGKGACLNFVSAVYRKHEGGIHTRVSEYEGYKIGYLTHKEIYLDNNSNIFLRKKYLHSFKNFINANIREGFLLKAFKMSMTLFFLNGNVIDLLKHLKRILTKLFKG